MCVEWPALTVGLLPILHLPRASVRRSAGCVVDNRQPPPANGCAGNPAKGYRSRESQRMHSAKEENSKCAIPHSCVRASPTPVNRTCRVQKRCPLQTNFPVVYLRKQV